MKFEFNISNAMMGERQTKKLSLSKEMPLKEQTELYAIVHTSNTILNLRIDIAQSDFCLSLVVLVVVLAVVT